MKEIYRLRIHPRLGDKMVFYYESSVDAIRESKRHKEAAKVLGDLVSEGLKIVIEPVAVIEEGE